MHVKGISICYLVAVMIFQANAETITVCNDCPFKTVKNAVAASEPQDTILVLHGIYKENNIVIDHPLTLIGKGRPVLDGSLRDEIFTIAADSSTISGFRLQHTGYSSLKEYAAIRVMKSAHCKIENNELIDTYFGIYLQEVKNTIVADNSIDGITEGKSDPGNAIHLWQCDNITVERNLVTGHRDGIYFEFVNNSRIVDNISINNTRYGLHFMFSHHDLYEGNTFESNGAGVAVMFSNDIRMINNLFKENQGGASYGILLKEINHGEMKENMFLMNTKGIYAEGTNELIISNNDFINNGWAIDIKGNSFDNKFIGNNFIGNTFDVVTNSKQNPNLFSRNYWSKHAGYDLDKDGYADQPYHPVSLFSLIIGKIPAAGMLLESMLMNLFDYAERVFPGLTPESLIDKNPVLKSLNNDTPSRNRKVIRQGESAGQYQRPV